MSLNNIVMYLDLYDECELELDNCEQECIDIATTFVCSCYDGYAIRRNGVSCFPFCQNTFTTISESFHTPSWPEYYPQNNFNCDWTIDLSGSSEVLSENALIVFTINSTAFGISSNCSAEYIEFLDGIRSNSSSLGRYCGRNAPPGIATTGLQARVIFHAHTEHDSRLQGIGVTYAIGQSSKFCVAHYVTHMGTVRSKSKQNHTTNVNIFFQ